MVGCGRIQSTFGNDNILITTSVVGMNVLIRRHFVSFIIFAKTNRDANVKILSFLNIGLQCSVDALLVIILTAFFCNRKTFFASALFPRSSTR
ncbi:hypothetical protein C0J52_12676 [Blattella germanica]|nr:hypothetical protein C0J52_12676 [Blattella germanica]